MVSRMPASRAAPLPGTLPPTDFPLIYVRPRADPVVQAYISEALGLQASTPSSAGVCGPVRSRINLAPPPAPSASAQARTPRLLPAGLSRQFFQTYFSYRSW